MTEENPRVAEVTKLRASNRRIRDRINKMGFETTGVEDNHIGALVNFLIKKEIITQDDALEFCLQWETELNDTLATLEMKAKNAATDLRKKNRLIVPGRG